MREQAAIPNIDRYIKVPGAQAILRRTEFFSDTEFELSNSEHIVTLPLANPGRGYRCFLPDFDKQYVVDHVSALPADVAYRLHFSKGVYRSIALQFDPSWFKAMTGISGAWELGSDMRVFGARIEPLLSRLADELTTPGFATEMLVEGMSIMAAGELCRAIMTKRDRDAQISGTLTFSQINTIQEHVLCAEGALPSIAEIAARVGMGRSHLMRLFKRTTGRTVYDYVSQIRLHKAAELLRRNECSIKEVAYRVGFATPESFAVAFRKAMGQTPTAFKKTRTTRGSAKALARALTKT